MVIKDGLVQTRTQVAKMGSLRRVAGVFLRVKVRSSVIHERLGVEPLLLCNERSQLRWFGNLVRMPPGRLPKEMFQTRPAGKRLRGRPWPGNASGSPSQSRLMWLGKGKSGVPS